MDGYIRLDRTILNWEWYTDVNTFKLFLHILLKANEETGQRGGISIPRGAVAISYQELSEETGLSVQNIRTSLKRMKKTGELEVESRGKFSIITVKNHDRYQEPETQKENIEHSLNNSANTDSNTVSNTDANSHQTGINKRFCDVEKDASNTVANMVGNTDYDAKKKNYQYKCDVQKKKSFYKVEMFDVFWDIYPRKEHKTLSRQEYENLFLERRDLREEEILKAAKNYAEYCRILEKINMFIYTAHNWLKKEIWMDYIPGNYKKPQPLNRKRSLGTGFSNFEQRDYDFDELENQILYSQEKNRRIDHG